MNEELLKKALYWIIPPLIGAIIGYVTNAVAIRMLFRPFKEIRIFGFRLPFTPGILPRKRHKLAESIGRMVEQELLTPGVLRERMAKNEVRGKLENTLSSYTDRLLERPLEHWLKDPNENSNEDSNDSSNNEFPIAELVKDFVNGEVFDSFLREIIENLVLGPSNNEESDDSFRQKLKSGFRDIGGLFVPMARDYVKKGLIKEMNNTSQGKHSSYRRALENIIEKYPNITTREFLSLGESEKQIIDSYLATKTYETLDKNIDGALSTVNIQLLVMNRIDALEMPRVEKIILDVMAGQLKWINVFGAILGALIGLTQVLLSFFIRV